MARDDEMSATIARLLDLATAEIDAPDLLGTSEDLAQPPASWLWEGYILRGKPTLIDARGDSGKTRLALQIAACATLGTFPFGANCLLPAKADPCRVLIVTDEDDPAEVAATFRELGGDLARLSVEPPSRFGPLEGDGISRLDRAITANSLGLVILDPALQVMPSYVRTQFDNVGITRWFSDLRGLAGGTNVGLLCVRHWAKGGGQREAHEAGAGGEAWRNGARGQLVLYKHPQSKRDWMQALVLPARNTLRVQYGEPFAIEIRDGLQTFVAPTQVDVGPYIEAYPQLAKRFPDAAAVADVGKGVRGPDGNTKRAAAAAILAYVRSAGGRARPTVAREALKERGFSERTIYRSRDELLRAGELIDADGYWSIPYDPAIDTAELPGDEPQQAWWTND